MHILFLVLNKTEYLDDILSAFVKIGIKGATIIDSQGMGSALVANENLNIPLVGSLKSIFHHNRPFNKVIFTVLEEELIPMAVKTVEEVVGDLSKPGIGMMFTLPLGSVYGLTTHKK